MTPKLLSAILDLNSSGGGEPSVAETGANGQVAP
jgi:hypothetical protein